MACTIAPWRWLPAAALVSGLVGCGSFVPHRMDLASTCELQPPVPASAPDKGCAIGASVETVAGLGPLPAFQVAYVEFTDQGWLHDRAQLERALALLRADPGDPRPLQVVAFVHGWKHGAAWGDTDVRNFRNKVVPAFAERAGKEVRTLGLYIGWRGNSIDAPGVRNITFYDRKSTAEHVARGSVRELISRLRAAHDAEPAGRRARVVLIGHSFGGLILYNAIAESLMDGIVRSAPGQPPRPLATLAVVINPAFEASRFEPVFQAALAEQAARTERPLFVSITTRNDWATGYAFPIGRWVNSLFDHEGWTSEDRCPTPGLTELRECHGIHRPLRLEKQANTRTMGHLPRYTTHTLQGLEPVRCRPLADLPTAAGGAPALAPQAPQPRNRFPLWTVAAEPPLIDGHSEIHRPELWRFLAELADPGVPAANLCPDAP